MAVRAQADGPLATFIQAASQGQRGEAVLREAPNVRNANPGEAEKAEPRVMGASAVPWRRRDGLVPVRGLPERSRPVQGPSVVVSDTAKRSAARRSTRWHRRLRSLIGAADRAAEEARAVPAGSSAGSANRTSTTPSSATCAARPAQGEAGRHGLARPADARRGGDDRPIVRTAMPRDGRPRARCSTRSSVIDSASTDRTREIAEAEGAASSSTPTS
jgi:hypothetical protein